MAGVLEIAAAILSTSEQRVGVSAQNMANMETPGFKRRVAFVTLLDHVPEIGEKAQLIVSRSDFSQGAMLNTGSPLDLAISGSGFFTLRRGDSVVYTRQGGFVRDGEGHLVRADGYVLQAASGGDLTLKQGGFTVSADGVVTQSGVDVARIVLVQADKPEQLQSVEGGFSAPSSVTMLEVVAPVIHQGMLEGSNVVSGQEMVGIIEASRRAEAGQRMIQVYDDLLGRVFGVLGGGQ